MNPRKRSQPPRYPTHSKLITHIHVCYNASSKKALCMASALHFLQPELCLSGGIGMKLKVRTIGLVAALFVSTTARLVPRVQAQETSPDAAKRKVKTKVVPDFPPLAKQMNVTGKVKIEATISPDGRVISTKI